MAYEDYDMKPGDWYKASTICFIISDILRGSKGVLDFDDLSFAIFVDGTLYKDEIYKSAEAKSDWELISNSSESENEEEHKSDLSKIIILDSDTKNG